MNAHDEFILWYRSLKNAPCLDCGKTFHFAAMTFDHLPGYEKTGTISEIASSGNRDRLLKEVAKCDLVCANCHAIRTHRRLVEKAMDASDLFEDFLEDL